MKIDCRKLDVQLARQCVHMSILRKATSAQTITRIHHGESVTPATVGKIARVEM